MLRGLAHSYDVVAPGQALATLSSASTLVYSAAGMWSAAVQISAPLLAATLAIDVLLAFLARASPQLPVLPMGMAVKAIAGFAVLWLTVAGWPHHFARWFAEALRLGERLLALGH
jgi:flagellar biosynthetic protein FliR